MSAYRYHFILLASIVYVLRAWGQPIPNPGFETWSAGNPANWYTTNTGFTNNITQSSTAHSGSFSAKGEITQIAGAPFPPGLTAGGITQRITIAQNYSAVTGYFQWYPHVASLTMSLYISVIFFDAQTQITAQGSLLCPFGTTASWQAFNVPMNYSGGSGNPSTSAHIQFTVSGTGNPTPADQIGSYFLLDDVAFAPPNAVVERTDTRPTLIALDQNYPNPFNPATTIRIDLPQQSFVDLRVYNLLGEEVASLVNQELKSGSYSTEWNAVGAASGVYVSVLRAGNSVLTRRMLLMK